VDVERGIGAVLPAGDLADLRERAQKKIDARVLRRAERDETAAAHAPVDAAEPERERLALGRRQRREGQRVAHAALRGQAELLVHARGVAVGVLLVEERLRGVEL